MTNNYFQYFKPKVLIIIIVTVTISILLINLSLGISLSILGMISFILYLINTKYWNKKWINWMFWVDDLSGTYEGKLRYQYIDEKGSKKTGELKHIKVINQNGYRISVSSFTYKKDGTPSSPSENTGMFVKKTGDNKHFQLIFNYFNDGNTKEGFQQFEGTDILKIIDSEEGKILSGKYYTNRTPQTKGEYIEMKWVSNNLNHKF